MRKTTWRCHARRWLVVSILSVVSAIGVPADPAIASPDTTGAAASAERWRLVVELTAERALTLARERRLAERAQTELFDQLQAADRAARSAAARAAGNAAELARVRRARDTIARQRQALIDALAERDRTLAAEVRAYREVITGILEELGRGYGRVEDWVADSPLAEVEFG